MGCRKVLEEPPAGVTADDLEQDNAFWHEALEIAAKVSRTERP